MAFSRWYAVRRRRRRMARNQVRRAKRKSMAPETDTPAMVPACTPVVAEAGWVLLAGSWVDVRVGVVVSEDGMDAGALRSGVGVGVSCVHFIVFNKLDVVAPCAPGGI